MNGPSQASSPKPWLRNSYWASRDLVNQSGVGWVVLGLAYLIGAALLAAAVMALREPNIESRIGGSVLAVFAIAALAWVTRFRLRHIRYGDTVCRLITLSGVVGGWFKADVECGLPVEAGPVTVRLKNEEEGTYWSMEQLCALTAVSGKKAPRSVVNVRLRVPRHPAQKFPHPRMRFALGRPITGPAWVLELEKKVPGGDLNFRATFGVPIYDTPDAPTEEQRPD